MYENLDNLTFEQMRLAFLGEDPDRDDYDYELGVYYEELVLRMIKLNESESMSYFLSNVREWDFPRLRGVIAGCGLLNKDSRVVKRLLYKSLVDSRPLIVAEAIESLTELGECEAIDHINQLKFHKDPYIRSSTIRYYSKLFPKYAIEIVLKGLLDESAIVRMSAVDEVGELTILESRELIYDLLLNDPDRDVREAAKTTCADLFCDDSN